MKNKTAKGAGQRTKGWQKQLPFFLLLGLCSLPFASSLIAGAGTSTADFLNATPDPLAAALGNCGVANAESGFSVYQNPALLGLAASRLRVAGTQTQWMGGVTAGHYAVSLSLPTRRGRRWGLGLLFNEWRSASFDATDIYGGVTGRLGYKAQNLGASLSREVLRNIHAGVTAKKVSQAFVESSRAGSSARAGVSALAWDAGLSWRTPWSFAVGASFQNAGSKMSFTQAREDLPRTLRLGAQGRLWEDRFTWTAEGVKGAGAPMTLRSGVAFTPFTGVALRAGYDTRLVRPSYVGLTSGVGFQFKNFSVDYAFTPFGALGNAQKASLTWQFGRAETEKKMSRRPSAPARVSNNTESWEATYARLQRQWEKMQKQGY